TPTRYGDPEGTARIFSYFGPIIPPPISLQDAITTGRLVPYEYYPHPVNLSAEEAQSWADLTKAIGLELRRSKSAEGATVRSESATRRLPSSNPSVGFRYRSAAWMRVSIYPRSLTPLSSLHHKILANSFSGEAGF